MGRLSSTLPARPRADRARRRIIFCAESLESRQLLSVAPLHPTISPIGNIPAAIGPVVPSPAGNLATVGAAASTSPGPEVVLQVTPVFTGQSAFHGFTETIFIFEEPASTGPFASTPSPSGNSSPSTGSAGSSVSPIANPGPSSTSITPLTVTNLPSPGSPKGPTIIVVVAPAPIVPNFASSTIPVTTQAILATAIQEEQPLPPPVLGQGFESGQTQGIDPRQEPGLKLPSIPLRVEPRIPAIDFIEPYRPEVVIPPAVEPARPAEVPAQPAPAANADPVQTDPIESLDLTDLPRDPEFPVLSPLTVTRTESETPSWSMAAMVGTAAIAGGGYHLVLGGSSRFNQRWIPTRRSSKKSGGRKESLA